MNEHADQRFQDDDAGPDWASLSSRLADQPADVTGLDVARLRRRVADAIPSPRRARAGRMLATAAAAVLGAVGLFAAIDRAPRPQTGTPIEVALAPDGGVVLAFEDGKSVHRITRSDDPVPGAGAETTIARGRTFVDKDGPARPGEVVFYRID